MSCLNRPLIVQYSSITTIFNIELKKYETENNEADFLEEQYELNSGIFSRNLSTIMQGIGNFNEEGHCVCVGEIL